MNRFAVLVFLAVSTQLRADDARDTVERAVRAHGGETALAKLKAHAQTAKGTINFVGNDVVATREGQLQLPERVRWSVELTTAPNKTVSTTLALQGVRGWLQVGRQAAADMTSTQFDDIAAETHAYWLATILPLRDPSVTVKPEADAPVNGKPAKVVVATKGNKPPVMFYFDKDGGLLIKLAFRGPDAGRQVKKMMTFANHREFEGVTLPTRISEYKDGQRAADWTVSHYRFVAAFEPGTFTKP